MWGDRMRMDRRAGLLKKAGLRSYLVFLRNENFGQTTLQGEYLEGDTVEVPGETTLGPVNCFFQYIDPDIPYTDDGIMITFTMPDQDVFVYYE